MYSWLIFLHVLGVFGFLMAHGVSASVAFALRRERNRDRIRALLDVSGSSIGVLHGSVLILLISGIAGGFIGSWWNKGWIWVSLGLLIATYIFMGAAGSGYYARIRKAVGLAYMQGFQQMPPTEPADDAEINVMLNQSRPVVLAVVGYVSLAIIALLMVVKPF